MLGRVTGPPKDHCGRLSVRAFSLQVVMEKHSSLGSPSLELGGLRLWLQGRHFPWEEGFWNGDWLVVTAHCHSLGADVRAHGPFLHTGDLPRWLEACERLLAERRGTAMLWALKPELQIALDAAASGLKVEVRLSPDQARQEHIFRFQVGWESLEGFAKGLRRHGETRRTPRRNESPQPCRLDG